MRNLTLGTRERLNYEDLHLVGCNVFRSVDRDHRFK